MLTAMLRGIQDRRLGKAPAGAKRSNHWETFRKHYLADHVTKGHGCVVCGITTSLELHHILPFHDCPSKELDPNNVIVLCEHPGRNCHLNIGHAQNWKGYNPDVARDARVWAKRILRSKMLSMKMALQRKLSPMK